MNFIQFYGQLVVSHKLFLLAEKSTEMRPRTAYRQRSLSQKPQKNIWLKFSERSANQISKSIPKKFFEMRFDFKLKPITAGEKLKNRKIILKASCELIEIGHLNDQQFFFSISSKNLLPPLQSRFPVLPSPLVYYH